MRACVFALAVTFVAQPALARDQAHKPARQIAQHHHALHGRAATTHQRRAIRVARTRREAPIESGYAMPKTFEEAGRPRQQAWQPMRPPGFAEAPARKAVRSSAPRDGALDAMIARHAAANGLPADLVRRVVIRESRYNPRARGAGGALGLMQIKHATARRMGYAGPASGLLDAETNLTYAVRYLAGAYRAGGGNPRRAVAYYAGGYHGRGIVARAAPAVTTADAWSMQSAQVAWSNGAVTHERVSRKRRVGR